MITKKYIAGWPIVAFLCMLVVGCENMTVVKKHELREPQYVDDVVVIAQICLCDKMVTFKDTEIDVSVVPKERSFIETREANGIHGHRKDNPATISILTLQGDKEIVRQLIKPSNQNLVQERFIPFQDVTQFSSSNFRSAGKSTLDLFGSTIQNQPVYETHSYADGELVALAISQGQNESIDYWFTVPKLIPFRQFTEWQDPASQEDDEFRNKQRSSTAVKLANHRDMLINRIEKGHVKIRFKSMTVEDYYYENLFWNRARKALREQVYRNITPEDRKNTLFAPNHGRNLPACQ